MRTPRGAVGLLVATAVLCSASSLAGALDPGTRLCLYPLTTPLDEVSGEERRAAFEARLVTALRAGSFEVADPPAVKALEERVRKDLGGTIDPATGVRDPEKQKRYVATLAKALREELGCGAQLVASVVAVRANYSYGVASWDGAQQEVSGDGAALFGAGRMGWVTALSLWLFALDLNGKEIAFRSAGIETPLRLAMSEDHDLVPEDLWLTNTARIDSAIASALGEGGEALRTRGTPAGVLAAKRRER